VQLVDQNKNNWLKPFNKQLLDKTSHDTMLNIILLNSGCNICCSTNVESSLALHDIVAVSYQEDVMSVQIHSFQIGKLVALLLNKYCYQCIILIFILIFNIIILINNLALLPVYGCV